jgi:hypothetical protein
MALGFLLRAAALFCFSGLVGCFALPLSALVFSQRH